MKKTVTAITLLAGAVSAYSQGTVSMQDYGAAFMFHVYAPQLSAPTGTITSYATTYGGYTSGLEYMGNVSTDVPRGDAVYNAGTALSGTGYDAQLLGAANTGDSLGSLSPLGSIFNFYTQSVLVGQMNSVQDLTAIPGSTPGTPAEGGNGATIALAAWANTGSAGAANSLLQAQQDGYAWGISGVVNVAATGGASNPPYTPPTLGIQTFSLGAIPEPGTIVLGFLGATSFFLRGRKGTCT